MCVGLAERAAMFQLPLHNKRVSGAEPASHTTVHCPLSSSEDPEKPTDGSAEQLGRADGEQRQ